ncbi:MAG: (Fe-S)-binding protein [Deltaproteobacteria bacterium]|nr:MAG: (Fe-S)-binding protein [Deltaproteobacteria bacterium]
MSHHSGHKEAESYQKLSERLNRYPQGAPPTELLFKILKILFKEEEARLVSLLPIKPFTARKAASIWKVSEPRAKKSLEALATRALLVDFEENGEVLYVLPPPMAGFFEFSMMRVRDDIDQRALGELFYQYMNVEEDFIKALFTDGETQLGRVFINEPALDGAAAHVLDYERATEVIRTASHMGVSLCYCRRKMEYVGKSCSAPLDICMTFNTSAQSLIRHGHARAVDICEGLDLLEEAYENNLVQFGENVRESVNFICNCCGCCCEAMIAARRFAAMHPIHTSNYLPALDVDKCSGCGKCVEICPVEAMGLVSLNDPNNPKKKRARLEEDICLGCGLCVRGCPSMGAVVMVERDKRVLTPLNGAHRAVLMAIERGKLQELLFDNKVLWSHRALGAFLGAFLKLPPVKRVLATEQVRSRFLEGLAARYG